VLRPWHAISDSHGSPPGQRVQSATLDRLGGGAHPCPMTRRTRILAVLGGLVVVALVAGLVLGGLLRPGGGSADNPSTGPGGTAQGGQAQPATPTPEPTPVPTPGHEVYGYLPYWEMTPGITDHLARVDLTTLALFSVTNKSGGAIDTTHKGD